MNQYSRRRGWSRRRRGRTRNNLPLILSGAVLALILLAGGIFFFKNNGGLPTLLPASPSNAPGGQASETPEETEPLTEEQELQNLLDEAKRLAAGYDYDGAIALQETRSLRIRRKPLPLPLNMKKSNPLWYGLIPLR